MSALWEILSDVAVSWFIQKVAKNLGTDLRNDPVYKKNVRELVERNRRFEKAE